MVVRGGYVLGQIEKDAKKCNRLTLNFGVTVGGKKAAAAGVGTGGSMVVVSSVKWGH